MTSTQLRPTRRTLVRGAAWTVPVVSIAAAAPAFAASACQLTHDRTLTWGTTPWSVDRSAGVNNVHVGTASVAGPAGTTPVTVKLSSVRFGSVTRDTDVAKANLEVSPETNVGNTGGKGLNISHSAPIVGGRSNRQEVTITLDRDVTNFKFTMTDIDSQRTLNTDPRPDRYEGWYDRVELTGSPVRTGAIGGNSVIGIGTNTADNVDASGPWRLNADSTNVAISGSATGTVEVTFASLAANVPVVLTYWSSLGYGNQRILLGNFAFKCKGC